MPGASPRCSNRRPAPRNSGRTRCASARATPASSSAASAAAAFRRLWSPGTPSSNETGSRGSPRAEVRAAARGRRRGEPAIEELANLVLRGVLGVVVELDIREDGDLRPQQLERPIRLVALRAEPAVPRAPGAAELGDLAADEERRILAEPVEAERDHPVRRFRPPRRAD